MERKKPSVEPSPLEKLLAAFKTAKKGEMPSVTSESLLQSMHLDGDEPDGLSFQDRLDGGKATLTDVRRSLSLMYRGRRLMQETNSHNATPEREALASVLGAVVSRHLVREEDGCGVITMLATESIRQDIISPEARRIAVRIREDF